MAITETIRNRLRRKLGDTGSTPAFSDAELDDLYNEAGEDFNQTMVDAIDELLANAAKFSDYTQNESQDKKSQVFNNLLKLRRIWEEKAQETDATGTTQIAVRFGGIRKKPSSRREYPDA